MKRLLIVYSTREGHTRKVAEYLVDAFHSRSVFVEISDAAHLFSDLQLHGSYDAVIVAGSVHVSLHESELVRFAKHHRTELEQMPSAFVSVSMSQAVLESSSTTWTQRQVAARRVDAALRLFKKETGWTPRRTLSVPGALLYRRYGPLVRMIMRTIARASGNPTDVTRDHVMTNWADLTRFAEEFASDFGATQPVPAAS